MKSRKDKTKASGRPRNRIGSARLAEMIEEATVDAHDEAEQATSWFTMFENCLELPFETEVLGVRVSVVAVALRESNQIVAVCRRGKAKLSVGIVDLPLPSRGPEGAEWVEAYRRWLGDR